MQYFKYVPIIAAAAFSLLSYQPAQAQGKNCSAVLPEFAAAMKAGTTEALSIYLGQHAPCFEGPAKAKLKALGGAVAPTKTKKSEVEKPIAVAEDKPENGLVADASCKKFANARSERGDESLLFKIINRTNETLLVSWINYEGKRQPPSDLLPGDSYDGKTYITHPFEVMRSDKTCVKIVMPKLGVSEYFIDK